MPYKQHINLWTILAIAVLLGFVVWSMGFDITAMVSILIFWDLAAAFVAIVKGFKSDRYGLIAGGAICGLIAMGSTSAVKEPTIGVLLLLILGGVVGTGAFIMSTTDRILR